MSDHSDNPFTSPSGPAGERPSHEQHPPPAAPTVPPGPAYQQQPPYGPPQPQQPMYGYGYPVLPDHPSAGTAMVLGLVSLIGGFFCGLPLLAGPFAWVSGARVRKEIDGNPGRYGGREKATAGMIMGIVATGLLALSVLVVIAAVVIILAAA